MPVIRIRAIPLTPYLIAGDTLSVLPVEIRDADTDQIIDLTDWSVDLRWLDAVGSLRTRDMTIVDAASGVASYQFLPAETSYPEMEFEARLFDASNDYITSASFILPVRAPLEGVPEPIPPDPLASQDSGIEVAFAFGDAQPAAIVTLSLGHVVYAASLIILEGFNGVGAALSVGDSNNPERLVARTQNDPGQTGTYELHPNWIVGATTPVLLFITPGSGATAGRGIVRILI